MDFDFPNLHGHVTIDTETHDPLLTQRGSGWCYDRHDADGGKVLGIAILCENVHEYLPIGHTEGNLDPAKVKGWLSEQLKKDPKRKLIFANCMYDLGWMRSEGIEWDGIIEDVQFQAPLLDESRYSYQLDVLAKDYLGIGKDEKALKEAADKLGIKNTKQDNVKKHLMRIHPDIVGIYAKQDVLITEGLWKFFNPLMEEQELNEVYRLECDLVPMLLEMRMRGVRVDVAQAEIEQRNLLESEAEARKYIKDISGITLGSWDNAKEISGVLDKLEIPYLRTEKTQQPSITQDYLHSLEHPVGEQILKGRKSSNLRSTFVENAILNLQQNGRVYPNFNQLRKDNDDGSSGVLGKSLKTTTKGTVSGRFSSSSPNFQQIPSPERDPILGHLVRKLFLPNEGEHWFGLDYSSQEPRGIVHFAELTNCRKAKEIADRYREDPNTDFHMVVRDMIRKSIPDFDRKPAKVIGLGLAYGMGGGKLAYTLGFDYSMATFNNGKQDIEYMKAGQEAQELLNTFNTEVPFIRELANKCQGAVRSKGFIHTPMKRRFRFPKDDSGKYMFLNKALNRLIQGTSADMTKTAMREMWRAGIIPLGSVHDEIDISTNDPKVVAQTKEIMETCFPLNIPILTDVGGGENWGVASGKGGEEYYNKFMKGEL